jgi:hypothetical protein
LNYVDDAIGAVLLAAKSKGWFGSVFNLNGKKVGLHFLKDSKKYTRVLPKT